MKTFEEIRLLQAVMKNGRFTVDAIDFPHRDLFTASRARIALSNIKRLDKSWSGVMAPALGDLWDHPPEPSVTQIGKESDILHFTVWDGALLHFYQWSAFAMLKGRAVFRLRDLAFVCDQTGVVDEDLADNDARYMMFMWLLVEAMRWNPDADLIEQRDADSTLYHGRRLPVPAATVYHIPDDVPTLTGIAVRVKSNREEITRMGHAFARTTLRAEDGRDRSGYVIECSRCKARDEIIASGHTGSLPQTVLTKKFKQKGWQVGKKCVCPTCLNPPKIEAKVISMPQAPVAIEPPRQMTAADKRRVFRAIDENWDESKGRYIGSASDQHLADTLNVPRAWIKDVREENFGKTQRNEDLDKLVGEAKNMRAEAARLQASALDLAFKFETMEKKIMEMQEAISRIE